MEDYKSNSYKSKADAKEEKKIEKVITGAAKTRKKSGARKMTDIFMPEDVGAVKNYILMDVFIPKAKEIIESVVHTILYGEAGSPTKRSTASKVSYRSYYDKGEKNRDYSTIRTRSGYDFDDIILESRGEAEEVLARMDEIVRTYGMVSVADLYDLVGITGRYTDNKYGWMDIRNAEVVRIREGYVIKLPKALPLD